MTLCGLNVSVRNLLTLLILIVSHAAFTAAADGLPAILAHAHEEVDDQESIHAKGASNHVVSILVEPTKVIHDLNKSVLNVLLARAGFRHTVVQAREEEHVVSKREFSVSEWAHARARV